jgi:hypothetical protein
MVDVLQVEQVLVNLLRNSIEAIGESGNPARSILIEAKLAGNEFVEVLVADSGPASHPSTSRIFLWLPRNAMVSVSGCRCEDRSSRPMAVNFIGGTFRGRIGPVHTAYR